MTEDKFVAAVVAMERRTRQHSAYVLWHKERPEMAGRITLFWSHGNRFCYVVAFIPDNRGDYHRYAKRAYSGCQAMAGAKYTATNMITYEINDGGMDWTSQLRSAGYVLVQAI